MLPTLLGRIQSRLFFLAVIGGPVTLIMSTILPASMDGHSMPLHVKYQDAFTVLGYIALFGVGWELLYHFLMQWRWEKDWPTFFGFATFVNEGLLVYLLVRTATLPGVFGHGVNDGRTAVPVWFFWIDFVVVWMVVWVWIIGPMRVVNIRWRFMGGRLI